MRARQGQSKQHAKQQRLSPLDDEEAMPMFSDTVSSSKCGKEASPPPILRFRSAGLLNQPRDNSPLEGRVEIACESPKHPKTPPFPPLRPWIVLSDGIWPSGWMPCSRQKSSQQALPICTPPCQLHSWHQLIATTNPPHIHDPVVLLIPMKQPTPN